MKSKRVIYIFPFVILFSVAVTAQVYKYVSFPTENAIWSEVYWKPISDPLPRWEYHKYAVFGLDTILNGIKYNKLFHSTASEITKENSEIIGGIREDSLKRIWFYCFFYPYHHKPPLLFVQNEIKLYDFNVTIGDTIRDLNFLLEYMYLIVKQIDTIKIDSSLRKVYSFYPYSWVYWIDGVGSVKGLIFTSGDLPTNGMDNDLVCFHHNDTLLYYNSGPNEIYDDCLPSFVLNGVSLLPANHIKVYPNPVSKGEVTFDNIDFETLELSDSSGKHITSIDIAGKATYKLYVSGMARGIYVYQLKAKGFVPVKGKLIVQ